MAESKEKDTKEGAAGVILDHELTEKEKADAAAMEIVQRTAPEPSLELYLWLKRKLFHEKGLDDVWLKIATHVGALEPPEGWIDEDNPGVTEPVTAAAKNKAPASKHESHSSLNP